MHSLRLPTNPTRVATIAVLLALSSIGCREEAVRPPPSESGEYPAGLTPKQAAMVLAKVGDHSITLGEYAAALDRMDGFDQLRYKSAERRRELLDEMIKVELLAKEAERRGLDKDPETQEALRQLLRDALLRDARKGARGPADFNVDEVKAYYDAHKDEYTEPERRRLSHIVVKTRKTAEELLVKALAIRDAEAWGRLVLENSEEYKGKEHPGPVEAAGDLGLVGRPGDRRAANPRVDERLQAAVFEVPDGEVMVNRVVQSTDGAFHVVRLVSIAKAQTRSFNEAERTIRGMMAEQEMRVREQQLEEDLRKKYQVTIDDDALSEVKTPTPKLHAPPSPGAKKPGADDHDPLDDEDDDHDHGH